MIAEVISRLDWNLLLTEKGYLPRIIDSRIDNLLDTFGAVCVEGSKWSGKTWTSLNHANSVFYIDDPAGNYQNRRLAELDPLYALEGEDPHLIDEWQEVPGLWDATRFAIDRSGEKGRFILTGSSVPPKSSTIHTGTGRIVRQLMRPMSLAESNDSTRGVSLAKLFNGELGRHNESITLDRIIWLTARGGWPGSLGLADVRALDVPVHYNNQTIMHDMSRVDGRKRNPARIERLLRSLARNNMTMVSNATLIQDIKESNASATMSETTLISYLGALKGLFIIEELPAWSPKIRSKARIRVSAKKHFVDPSLAIAALGVSPEQMKSDLNTFGFMFENLVIRDIRIYAEALGGRVFHYRDNQGLEADAIIVLPDNRWAAVEVKLGVNDEDKAADSLLRVAKKIVGDGGSPPAFLAVICGVSNFSYTRSDGVHVVPVTALDV
jgi:predicted AAA+ superfamily ATPase